MKSKFVKIVAGVSLLAVSALAFAASPACCDSLACCLQMLGCC